MSQKTARHTRRLPRGGRVRTPNWRLIRLMRLHGLTAPRLAERILVSADTIRRCEKGHTPRPYIQRDIVRALGLPDEDMFTIWPLDTERVAA